MPETIHLLTFDKDDLAITRCGLRPGEDAPATTSTAKATCRDCKQDRRRETAEAMGTMSDIGRAIHARR